MRECLDEGVLQSYFDGELARPMAEGVASHLAACVVCTEALRELESEDSLLSAALEPEFATSVPTERLRQRVEAAIAGRQLEAERANVVSNAGATPAVPVGRGWAQAIAGLFTLAPQRAFGFAGLAAVIVLGAVLGGIYWSQVARTNGNRAALAVNGGVTVPLTPIAAAEKIPTPKSQPASDSQPVASGIAKKRNPPVNQREESAHVRLLPGERSYLKTIAVLNATLKAESSRQMKPALQSEYERNLAMVDQAIAATRTAAKVNPNDPDAADFMFAAYQSKIDLLSQVADSRLSNRQH